VRSVLGAQVRVRSLDANLGSSTFHHIFFSYAHHRLAPQPLQNTSTVHHWELRQSPEMKAFGLAFGKARLKNESLTFGAFMATYNYQIIVSEARLCSIPVKSTP
jgi:hypothetical protein